MYCAGPGATPVICIAEGGKTCYRDKEGNNMPHCSSLNPGAPVGKCFATISPTAAAGPLPLMYQEEPWWLMKNAVCRSPGGCAA